MKLKQITLAAIVAAGALAGSVQAAPVIGTGSVGLLGVTAAPLGSIGLGMFCGTDSTIGSPINSASWARRAGSVENGGGIFIQASFRSRASPARNGNFP